MKYSLQATKEQSTCLEANTREQSGSKLWFTHKQGALLFPILNQLRLQIAVCLLRALLAVFVIQRITSFLLQLQDKSFINIV